jgi:NitT/TauT family transport system substrate-binding protein
MSSSTGNLRSAHQSRRLGAYELGFADLNAHQYRDQHHSAPIKAVFIVYNKPAYSIVAQESQHIEPNNSSTRKSAPQPAGPPLRNGAIRQAQ